MGRFKRYSRDELLGHNEELQALLEIGADQIYPDP